MKITVKKNLIIFHRPSDWDPIQDRLSKEYGAKIMISYVCKRELGFTVRRHKGLEPHDKESWVIMKSEGWDHRYYYQDQIHLDFYNDAQMSWFVLKYLDL
jgi:hypothetical protein